MKKIFSIVLIFAVYKSSLGQNERFIQPNTNLYTIRQQLQPFYDSLLATGDSAILDEGQDYAEYKKFMDFWGARLFPHGDFEKYFEAQNALFSSTSTFANSDPWWEIGPNAKPSGGVGIGPIRLITIYKNDITKMLATSTVGGLFYSTDGGDNWINTGTDNWQTSSGVQSVVFDPNDYHKWYALSSGQGRNSGMFIGYTGGLFRTTNQGQSWTRIGAQADFGSIWTRFNKLIIDPSPQNVGDVVVFVASTDGIARTNHADQTNPVWTKLTIPFLPTNISDPNFNTSVVNYSTNATVYDLEFKPQNSQTIFGTIKYTGSNGQAAPNTKNVTYWRLIRSNDGGNTWFEIPNQPTNAFYRPDPTNRPYDWENASFETVEVTNIAQDNLYFLMGRSNAAQGQLWIYNTSTNSWPSNAVANNLSISFGGGNGFGVNQFDQNEVWLSYDNNFMKINYTGSTNSGQSIVSNGQYHMDVEGFTADPVNSNIVWMANHGGVYKSLNHGASGTWQDKSNGIGNTWVYRMATSYTDPSYISMGLDHDWSMVSSSPYTTTNWHPTWNNSYYTGDGQRTLIDHKDPHYIYYCSHQGTWSISSNFGNTFSFIPQSSPIWIGEGVLNKKNPSTLYRIITNGIGIQGKIMRSFDRGNTNTTIADFSQAPFNYTAYTTIKLFTPKANADYLLVHVVTDQGATNPNGVFERNHLWRTKNANDPVPTWEELPLPRNAWPATVDFDLDNPDITYIVYSSSSNFTNSVTGTDMIFKMDYTNPAIVSSYNCGPCPPPNNTQLCCSVVCNSGCTDLTQNLANSGIGNDAFAVEEGTNGGLYVGTDFGVYYTNNSYLNNFVGWQKFGTILPNVQCYGMEINYPANKIRVGLYGRGIWEHSLFCPTDQDITLKASIPSDFYEAENNVLITTQFVTVTTNTGDINVRAGNEIDLQIGPNKPGEQIVLNANTRLFIHACDHIGNSFRHQNHTRDNSSLDLAAFTSAKNNEEKKIYEGENGKYTLYPNPFTDHLHIDFLLEKSSDVNISIYNSLGQEIENIANTKYETGSYSLLFDKTNLSSGIYFVKLSIGDKYYTKAVIKK